MAETPQPNGADLDPIRPRPSDPSEGVGPQNEMEQMARNQSGQTPTESVRNLGLWQRFRRRMRFQRTNVPESTDMVAENIDEMNRAEREAGLNRDAANEMERRANVQQIEEFRNADELVDWLVNCGASDEGFDLWFGRKMEQKYPGYTSQSGIQRFTSRTRAFLAGEMDVERGDTAATENTFRRQVFVELGRRGLKALFNRKNLGSAALMVGVGALTGGVAPMLYAALGGMAAGRAIVETAQAAGGGEAAQRIEINRIMYRQYEQQVDLARQIVDKTRPDDEKERLTRELLDLFYNASTEVGEQEKKLGEIKKRQNRASDWGAALGSMAGIGIGAAWNYMQGGFNGLMQFMGKLDVDWNGVYHGVREVNGSLGFLYNAGETPATQMAGLWAPGHVLGSSMTQVGIAAGVKAAEYTAAGLLGGWIAGLGNGNEGKRSSERTDSIIAADKKRQAEMVADYDKTKERNVRQESYSAVEATAERLGKPMPREGELWFIQNLPDRSFSFRDVYGTEYREGDGTQFVVVDIDGENRIEIASLNPETGRMDHSRRATLSLHEFVESFQVNPESNRDLDKQRRQFEQWLVAMELDKKLVKEGEQRIVLRNINGVIVNFEFGPEDEVATYDFDTQDVSTRRTVRLHSGNYRLTSINFNPFTPYGTASVVDLAHPDRPTLVIGVEDLIKHGRRAYPEAEARGLSDGEKKPEPKGPDKKEEPPKDDKKKEDKKGSKKPGPKSPKGSGKAPAKTS